MIFNPLFPFIIRDVFSNDAFNFDFKEYCQIIFINKGQLSSGTAVFDKGAVLFVNSNTSVTINPASGIECSQMIFKPKLPAIMRFSDAENELYSELFLNQWCKKDRIVTFNLDEELSIEVSIIFKRIMKEFRNKEYSYHTVIKGGILELIVMLSRIKDKKKSEIKSPVDTIIDLIDENYCDEISLGHLSSVVNLNPSYISRIFKEKTGKNIFEYVNEKRIKKAAHLLKNTNLSVLEISMMVGFNNLSFFNRTFRKLMNTSPREYRM
jgi:AraC-like DNA-binding protein